jgi:hypothetical protein
MPKVPRHSERSEESRKRLRSGERRLLACRGRQLADHMKTRISGVEFPGAFRQSCRKEQAGSLCSPRLPRTSVGKILRVG